jgi:F420-dependent oxidoreductase-like protein
MTSVDQVRREALWAASAGFDSFWVSQAFGVDPLVAVAAVGRDVPGFTELGTSVVPLVGRHPLALAAEALTVQSALEGRLVLGVGASHQVVAEHVFGESYDRPYSRTKEFLEALIPLLEGEAADVSGDQVVAHGGLTIHAPPCPVLLAALAPRMLRLAGTLTAGTSLGQCGPKTIATHVAPILNAAAEAAGRVKPRIMALVSVVVTDDPSGAREAAVEASRGYAALPSYRRVLDLEGVTSGAELLVAGSLDQVAAGLTAYVEAGVTDLRIGLGSSDPDLAGATRAGLSELLGG